MGPDSKTKITPETSEASFETWKAIEQGLQDYRDGKVLSHAEVKECFRAYAQEAEKNRL